MKVARKPGKAWLIATARSAANELKQRIAGTRLRIRVPSRAASMNTDGWAAVIGDLGKNQPTLEIWLDRFSGHKDRKLWACFHSTSRRQMTTITKRVGRKLVPIRVLTVADTDFKRHLFLSTKLPGAMFHMPILENYENGRTYYGLYDVTHSWSSQGVRHFLEHALAFFESVARTLPNAKAEDDSQEVYPQYENRKHVKSHLVRERSRLLATARKIMDDYECQVCGLRFDEMYGKLGIEFAEAHHLVALSQLKENVKTRVEDLATVCANCHRMLHRMDGKGDDIKRLRAIVRRHRGDAK